MFCKKFYLSQYGVIYLFLIKNQEHIFRE